MLIRLIPVNTGRRRLQVTRAGAREGGRRPAARHPPQSPRCAGTHLIQDFLYLTSDEPVLQESATPQDPAGASSAPKLTREHARIAWSSSAPNLIQLQRGIAHQVSSLQRRIKPTTDTGHLQYPLWSTFSTPSTPASTSIQLELAPSVMPPSSAAIHLTASKTGSLMLDPSTKPATLLARCGGASGDILGVARVKVAGGKWVAGSEWASVRNSRVVVLE